MGKGGCDAKMDHYTHMDYFYQLMVKAILTYFQTRGVPMCLILDPPRLFQMIRLNFPLTILAVALYRFLGPWWCRRQLVRGRRSKLMLPISKWFMRTARAAHCTQYAPLVVRQEIYMDFTHPCVQEVLHAQRAVSETGEPASGKGMDRKNESMNHEHKATKPRSLDRMIKHSRRMNAARRVSKAFKKLLPKRHTKQRRWQPQMQKDIQTLCAYFDKFAGSNWPEMQRRKVGSGFAIKLKQHNPLNKVRGVHNGLYNSAMDRSNGKTGRWFVAKHATTFKRTLIRTLPRQ